MDTITLRYNGNTTEHRIYSREEADAAGIQYRPWREVPSEGWALTDDGYVAQCLHVKEYLSRNGAVTTVHVFAFWNIWNSPRAMLIFKGYKDRQRESLEKEQDRNQTMIECARLLIQKGITKEKLKADREGIRKAVRKKKGAGALLRLADLDARELRKVKEWHRQQAWRAKRKQNKGKLN